MAVSKQRTIDYLAGLDGIRGACLLGVFMYHAPYDWAKGFLFSVSTFFTLSGYLITTLLLRELYSTGTVDLTAFWERRMRRLGPALWLGVGLTLITSPLWLDEAALEKIGLDGFSAVFFLSNWRYMAPEYSYSKLFAAPSPLQHCWTLAIEAQYYLIIPLVLELVVRRTKHVGTFAWMTALVFASVASGWLVVSGQDSTYRGYYGTDVRAGELLLGALLAVAVDAGWLRQAIERRTAATAVGVVSLACIVVGWSIATVEAPWLYRGGFAIYSVFSAGLILSVLAVDNPVKSLFSFAPLAWVGKVSYGAYVLHWPIFLWLNEERTGLQHDVLFVVRVALSLTLAGLSYRFVEEPVRRRHRLVGRTNFAMATVAAGVAALAAVVVSDPSIFRPRSAPVVPLVSLDRTFGFAVFGDSTARNLNASLGEWLRGKGMRHIRGHTELGCSLVDSGARYFNGIWMEHAERCKNLRESWRDAVRSFKPDVAVVLIGTWDVRDRRLTVVDETRAPGDPVFDAEIRGAARETIEVFREEGVKTVWLTAPKVRYEPKPNEDAAVAERASDPARMSRLNEIIREVVAEYPEDARIVDFEEYLDNWPDGPFDPVIRDHGVHYTKRGRKRMALWLGPEVVRAAYELIPAEQ